MAVDNRTTHYNWPLPFADNTLADDVHRLVSAINGIDSELASEAQVRANAITLAVSPLTTWTVKTGPALLTDSARVIADMQSGPFTLTLPAAPAIGASLRIKVVNADQHTLTLNGNGGNIYGNATVTVTYPFIDMDLVYLDAIRGWV
jgi:hypothetical protein